MFFKKIENVFQQRLKKFGKFNFSEDIPKYIFRKNTLVYLGISWYILIFTSSVLTNRIKISSHFINFVCLSLQYFVFFSPPLLAQKFSTNFSSIFHLLAKQALRQ